MTEPMSPALAADAPAQSPERARVPSPSRASPAISADAAGGNGQPFDRARYQRDVRKPRPSGLPLSQSDAPLTIGEAVTGFVLTLAFGAVLGAMLAIAALSGAQ